MKYVRCDNCNILMEEGSDIYRMPGLCGIFCSTECFCEAHAETTTLTDQLVEDCCSEWIEQEESTAEEETTEEDPKVDQKKIILDYLEEAYSGALAMDDMDMALRISRAIISFSCDTLSHTPTWEDMQEEYLNKNILNININCCGS